MPDRQPTFGYLTPERLPLFTDLYELTMMRGFDEAGHEPTATFQLFVRDLPPDRGYLVVAGLEQVVHYLESLSFGEEAVSYLAQQGFPEDFLDRLADLSFSGEVRALPEGELAFPNEPLVEVTAPIFEGQLFETLVINQVGVQSLLATKAARMWDAVERFGDGQALVDFGSRRAHGTDAGLKAARAAYVGGFDGTSNVAAGEAFDVPIYGTMAHSWVQSFPSERASFEAFVDVYGDDSVLLIDTYDTVDGARIAREVAESAGVSLAGVRLDSGDLTALSKTVREVLPETDLFISSGVDEFFIREFFEDGGIGQGFGPGTALVTSTDAPKLEGVYKLVAVEREGELAPSMKLSAGKVTYPEQKDVRRVSADGQFVRDVLAERGEEGLDGEQLLEPVFEDGERVAALPSLDEIRERTRRNLRSLPTEHRRFRSPTSYPVEVSPGLSETTDRLAASLRERES